MAAAVATVLLAAAGESSPASASPAPGGAGAAGAQYLYWTNQNRGTIGRARLNGTDVNQSFVAKKDFLNLHGVAVGPGRY